MKCVCQEFKLYMKIYLFLLEHTLVFRDLSIPVYISLYLHLCIYSCICIAGRIHIHIHTYTHINMYTYILHMHKIMIQSNFCYKN